MGEGPGAFAELVRRHREAAALSQEELADRAGLTAKAIGALERGERRRPYPHTVRALADALGLDDDERTALTAAVRPGETAAAPGPRRTGIPAATTPLVGRDAERQQLLALIRTGSRLVTLTGPGGVGKTSLALDAARQLAPLFPSATAVVELAPVRDAALVLPAVARALGLRSATGSPVDAVADLLGDRRSLLLLDNLEQVLDAGADVAELLARCPGLHVLATSRAALRVRAEQELPLGPLAVPAGSGQKDVERSPAAQVFLDRSRAAGRAVELSGNTAADVAAICRRLDGLPLALELAAAHARFLSPSVLLARLDSALGFPGARDLPERQRTIRATLDWSYELLTEAEQTLLRRLSVLVGGFGLDAAEAVGGDLDVLPALAGLIDQSLVVADGERYRMLEPIRQYAAGKLAGSGEADDAADRAAGHFLALAAGAREGLRGAEQAQWLDVLDTDRANLSATFARLLATGRAGDAARLGDDTWLYWALRGNATEALGWLERTRSSGAGLDPRERAALELATGGLRYATGNAIAMAAPAAAAEQAAIEAGDDDLRAQALVLAGSAAVFRGNTADGAAQLAEAERLAAAAGDRWVEAHAAAADGQRLLRQRDLAGAATALGRAEGVARDLGSPFTLATVLNGQATLADARGDDAAAFDRLVEAAVLAAEIGTPWTLAYALPRLGALAARRGQPELAAELYSAAAEAMRVTVAFPPDPQKAERQLAAVREELGEEVFARAWERGKGRRPGDVPELASLIRIRRGSS